MSDTGKTSFSLIYDAFLSRITDSMYMEWTEVDTFSDLQDMLLAAINRFEFPRFNIYDYEEGYLEDMGVYEGPETNYDEVAAIGWIGGYFNAELTREEINIIAVSMMVEWFGRQLATTELTKEKYSGNDFKFTSQANHMAKLKVMIDSYKQECFHLQRLYKRRKVTSNGDIISMMGQVMSTPSYGYVIGGIDDSEV